MSGLRRTQLYRAILGFLAEEGGPVELDVICAETGAQSYHLKMLEQRELISFSREEIVRDPLAEMLYTPDTPPLLLPDQQAAWEELAGHLAKNHHGQARRAPAPVLLLGVTGSGKTELYLRATAQVLDRGQQALILVPEISLTPQTVRRFMVRFPGRVGLWHSQMSRGERYDTWQRVRSGEIDVIVGARSALFTPFPDLGLIVIDEEEDVSYKQSRQPYYHARETAAALARLTGALLVLGQRDALAGGLRAGAGGPLSVDHAGAADRQSQPPGGRLAARASPAPEPLSTRGVRAARMYDCAAAGADRRYAGGVAGGQSIHLQRGAAIGGDAGVSA